MAQNDTKEESHRAIKSYFMRSVNRRAGKKTLNTNLLITEVECSSSILIFFKI